MISMLVHPIINIGNKSENSSKKLQEIGETLKDIFCRTSPVSVVYFFSFLFVAQESDFNGTLVLESCFFGNQFSSIVWLQHLSLFGDDPTDFFFVCNIDGKNLHPLSCTDK